MYRALIFLLQVFSRLCIERAPFGCMAVRAVIGRMLSVDSCSRNDACALLLLEFLTEFVQQRVCSVGAGIPLEGGAPRRGTAQDADVAAPGRAECQGKTQGRRVGCLAAVYRFNWLNNLLIVELAADWRLFARGAVLKSAMKIFRKHKKYRIGRTGENHML